MKTILNPTLALSLCLLARVAAPADSARILDPAYQHASPEAYGQWRDLKYGQVQLLGVPERMAWRFDATRGLVIELPASLQPESARPCRQAYAFKIEGAPVNPPATNADLAQTRLLRLEAQTRDPKTSQVLPQTITVESSKIALTGIDDPMIGRDLGQKLAIHSSGVFRVFGWVFA